MSEEAGFSLQAGKDVITNPTQLKNLYENDLFDPTNLIAAIRDHDFGVIVFRAQFYPPPVLAVVYEAYYPDDVIRMNGFDYEIWRPGPPQDERAAFALAQESLTSESQVTQAITLPFEQAARWLNHALMTYHNWEPLSDATAISDAGECLAGTFQKNGTVLSVELCPAASGAELTLTGDSSP
jgi:hypothetical protein